LLVRTMFDLRIGGVVLCLCFGLAWFAVAAFNMGLGMHYAAYSFGQELPFFLLVFSVPTIAAAATIAV